jgi:hypothetical protein
MEANEFIAALPCELNLHSNTALRPDNPAGPAYQWFIRSPPHKPVWPVKSSLAFSLTGHCGECHFVAASDQERKKANGCFNTLPFA